MRRNRLVPALAIMTLAASGPARAETQAPAVPGVPSTAGASGASETPEAVIVTGTRTSTSVQKSLSPITVVTSAQLRRTGMTDLRDALTTLVPSLTRQSVGFDTANLTDALKMRGLSPDQLLVLVNGKRRHTTANINADSSPQQGSTPVDLDMIPMSAVDHIEVLRDGAAAQYGSDAVAGVVNVILKSSASGGSAQVLTGQTESGDGFITQVGGDSGVSLGDRGALHISADFRHHDHTDRSGIDNRVGRVTSAIIGDPESNRETFGIDGNYDISPHVQLYGFATYAHRSAQSYQYYRLPTVLPSLYPYGFSPLETIDENDFGTTLGAKGDALFGWHWDLSSTYGMDRDHIGMINSGNTTLFTATGSTPTDFFLENFTSSQWTTDFDLTRPLRVPLLPTPVDTAFGIEQRYETYDIGAGDPASYYGTGSQSLPGLNPVNSGRHARDVYAAYLDFTEHLTPQWTVEAAGRFEHYTDAGSTETGKLSTRYDFSPRIGVRATVSNGFRAPSLAQEYFSNINITPSYASGTVGVNSAAGRALGAQPLKPELSTNVSVGLVLRPVDRLNVTVDAYQIRIRDRVIIGGLYSGAAALGALEAQGATIPGYIASSAVSANYYSNGASTRTSGIDIVSDYQTALFGHDTIDWTLAVNFNNTSVTHIGTDGNGNTLLSKGGISNLETRSPRNKVILGGLWRSGRWDVNLRETRYGHTVSNLTNYYGPNAYSLTVLGTVVNSPKYTTDIEIGYRLSRAWHVALGANNLFDVMPNKVPYNNRYLGINLYDGAGSNIGVDGGFYYARLNYSF